MPNNNKYLHKAKNAKKDEFYTQLSDIEKELKHYTKYLKGKKIYCNCDDYEMSNFVKYFKDNFKALELVSLTSTCYVPQGQGKCLRMDENGSETYLLDGDGDFRSDECIELLKECDIVITNPPFSLFREYMAQLIQYEKNFLIIGNMNAIAYNDIFPLIKENKIWFGYKNFGSGLYFILPDFDENKVSYFRYNEFGQPTVKVNGCIWFTNLPNDKCNEMLPLTKKYTPEEYPKYDNYNAINVNKLIDIPMDYDGVMGVPITFLEKYNPHQFELVSKLNNPIVNGKLVYKRILIRKIK